MIKITCGASSVQSTLLETHVRFLLMIYSAKISPSWNKSLSLEVKVPNGTNAEIMNFVQSQHLNISLFSSISYQVQTYDNWFSLTTRIFELIAAIDIPLADILEESIIAQVIVLRPVIYLFPLSRWPNIKIDIRVDSTITFASFFDSLQTRGESELGLEHESLKQMLIKNLSDSVLQVIIYD